MKTFARQGFLLFALLLAISNSVEIPDLVEELDDMIDSPYTKFNEKKAGNEDDDDDAMSDDTSSSTDEDKEMMETAEMSHQEEKDNGMSDNIVGNDEKMVGKSKIQHNSNHTSNVESGNEDDEMESKDGEEDDKAENSAEDNLIDKEKDNKKSKENKDKANDKVEKTNEDETTSSTKNLPEVKKVPVSSKNTKQNEVSSSKSNTAMDVESIDSDEKASIKDKDNKNDAKNNAKTKSIKESNDEPKITSKNTNSKDAKILKAATNDQNNDNEKFKPAITEDTKNAEPATNDNSVNKASKPTTKSDDNKKKQVNNNNNNNNNNDDDDDDDNNNDNNNDSDNNDDDNDVDDSSKHKDNNDNSINETEQQPLKTSDNDENKTTGKPTLTTDNKTINDKPEDTKAATNTNSIKNEDNKNKKIEDNIKNKDSDKPELSTTDKPDKKVNEDSKLAEDEDEDINQLKQTAKENMDNKINEKQQLTMDDNTVSENTEKVTELPENDKNNKMNGKDSTQTSSDNLVNDSTEKAKSETNENNDKSKNGDDNLISTSTKDKPENFPNANLKNTGTPDNPKASNFDSNVKDINKNEQQNDGQHTSEEFNGLPKDNNKLKEEALPKGDDVIKDSKNSYQKEGVQTDYPNNKSAKKNDADDKRDSNKHDDIKSEVERLSMKIGDESEEEKETLGLNNDKVHGITADEKESIGKDKTELSSSEANDEKGKESIKSSEKSVNENDKDSLSQEHGSDAQQVQDDTSSSQTGTQSMNKADVVNTLARGPSGKEKAEDTSASEVNIQTSEDKNIQENLADQSLDKTAKDKKGNVEGLLHDLVPSGILPNLPEGFEKLSDMSTVSFTYNVHENNDVTVTSDIKEPMRLFHGKLDISNANLEFSYNNKEKKGQKWQLKAQGNWVNGEQEINVILESSKHDDHFTLTGKGSSLALHDYSSMFAKQETFVKSGMKMHAFEEIMLSDIELYVVFKDFENIVSLVSGNIKVGHRNYPTRCQTFIEKFPKKDPVFSILMDFVEGSPHSVLTSLIADKISNIPFVNDLLDGNGSLKVANGGFGFAASSADVKKLRLNVFGEGMLERDLGSHISSGVTLTLPISFHSQNDVETHDIIMKISQDDISFFPTKGATIDLTKIFKTLSEFTRPKISSLGYPDVGNVLLRELRYDLQKSVYTILGYSTVQFNIAPGMLYLDDANLEFRQQVPDEFATLALYGSGNTKIGQAKVNITLYTDTNANELLINGHTHTLLSPDIASSFGVTMEIDDDVRRILDDNRMLNMNIENVRMFATVKDGQSGLVHFSGYSRPMSWNDGIQIEAVVFHDHLANKRQMTVGYVFDKLPLTYAIDAFSFNQFPTPRLLDNSRNTTLVFSPVNSESLFLNPAFNDLSFMRGLSLVGQFRLPDVCSLSTLCESAVQLLGTEKWYRIQGLISTRGYTLAGYVDKDFNLAKDLKLTDNILQFKLGNYSYMGISTTMHLDKNNLTFNGFVNFDTNGVRLRMSSNDVWKHPFPGEFLFFDRLQIDVPLISGMPMDQLLVTGELNFGLRGSLYRIFAPSYLTFSPSKPKEVGFQATMANITLETITSSLNFKSSLPEVLINSRFPDALVVRYTPMNKMDVNLELYGKLDILSRTLICKIRIDSKKHIKATTSHSKFPLILDDGLVTVYADKHQPRLGPRAWFTVTPESTKFKLDGFANFMGLGTKTEIDVSESGTEFSLSGNLFGVTKTVISFMSPDSLPENGPYFASACLPDIIPHVTSHVNLLLASAADQAERYVKQASANFNQATMFYKQAVADEHKRIQMLDDGENDVENDDREMFLAEERYNKTCREQHCGKTCIGCTSWRKCCDHDVFGNCVKCPGWKPCCWHGKSPICKAKNHACRIMKQVAAETLQKIARRVYADKEKKRAKEKILWKSEFMKGKTQAVLDAARRAVQLVNHDSRVGLGAAKSIKRFGLERLVNINSVCFHTTLKTLATSCVTLIINSTFANEAETQSLPYYACLNRELVPKIANHVAHFMFHDKEKAPKQAKASQHKPAHRSNLFGKPLEEEQVDLTTISPGRTYIMRKRREYDPIDDDMESTPFWLIRNNYQIHVPSLLQQRTTVPRSPLRRKWQIPASKKGKCKVYRQLVEICKDMMGTVKKMFESYEDGKEKYHKRLTELQLGLNTTIYDLEKQVMDTPELRDRLADIEMNIRTVGAGVNQWKINCETDQEDQNKIAVREWVSTMEERIRKLGGQGVDRFLSNLFRAFEGMFLGAETPKHSAQKVLNTLQAIREISATFHDIFGNNEITLEKAASRAEIVMSKLKQIKDAQLFCDD